MRYPALLLNATYEPLRVVSWKKALVLVFLKKAEVIEEYDKEVRSVSSSFRLPSILRLLPYVKSRPPWVKFSRYNVYLRDGFRCQYCGEVLPPEELTCDHVIPRSKGGVTDWTNVVTCCKSCNYKKGGRTPQEAGMKLLREPSRPLWLPFIQMGLYLKELPSSWLDYFYCEQGQRRPATTNLR